MKKILLILLLSAAYTQLFAQDDIKARFEFEAAEEAFSKGKYSTAYINITKAEELLKVWTPKVAYLKIQIMSAGIEFGDTEDSVQYRKVSQLKAEVEKYMKYAEDNRDKTDVDKLRIVYEIQRKISGFELGWKYDHSPEKLKIKEDKKMLNSFLIPCSIHTSFNPISVRLNLRALMTMP